MRLLALRSGKLGVWIIGQARPAAPNAAGLHHGLDQAFDFFFAGLVGDLRDVTGVGDDRLAGCFHIAEGAGPPECLTAVTSRRLRRS